MGGKSSSPTPADPVATAGAQTSSNIGTAIAQQSMGLMNQNTPDGSLSYSQTGSQSYTDPISGQTYQLPQYTATQTLSESGQKLKDTSDANQQGMADLASKQMSFFGSMPGYTDYSAIDSPELSRMSDNDYSEDRQRVEDTLMQRMQGGLDSDKSQLEARLASQGIRMGSEAYTDAMGDYGRSANDARMAAILGAGQEQSRLTGLDAQRVGVNNNAELQEFGAEMSRGQAQDGARSNTLSEIMALMGGGQAQAPNFVSTQGTPVANTDFAGLQASYDNQMMQQYEADQSRRQALIGGILGAGSNLLMASDERVKTDITQLGKTDNGLGIYKFRYKSGGPMQIGLMAQEVEKAIPDAVVTVGGVKMVNYDKALGGAA